MRIDAVDKANEVLVNGGADDAVQCAIVRFSEEEDVRSRKARAAGEIIVDLFVPMSTSVAKFEKMSTLIEEAVQSQQLIVAGQFPTSFEEDSVFETLAPFTTTVDPDAAGADSANGALFSGNSLSTYGIIIAIVFLAILLVAVIVIVAKKYGNRDGRSFYFKDGGRGGSTLSNGGSSLIFKPHFDMGDYLQVGMTGGAPSAVHVFREAVDGDVPVHGCRAASIAARRSQHPCARDFELGHPGTIFGGRFAGFSCCKRRRC